MSSEETDGRPPRIPLDREGIYIEAELADSIAIEEELDANITGVYRFPDPQRRRLGGWVFLLFAISTSLWVESGWILGLGFALIGVWHFLAAWPLAVDENQAMAVAGAVVDFPVGHASAAIRFYGWRSRPRWSVLLYSAVEPPDQRALVVVDAVSGEVVEKPYVEAIEPV